MTVVGAILILMIPIFFVLYYRNLKEKNHLSPKIAIEDR